MDLSRFPLKRKDFLEMADRIIDLYSRARAERPQSDATDRLAEMLDEELERNPNMTARAWVRLVVGHLQEA